MEWSDFGYWSISDSSGQRLSDNSWSYAWWYTQKCWFSKLSILSEKKFNNLCQLNSTSRNCMVCKYMYIIFLLLLHNWVCKGLICPKGETSLKLSHQYWNFYVYKKHLKHVGVDILCAVGNVMSLYILVCWYVESCDNRCHILRWVKIDMDINLTQVNLSEWTCDDDMQTLCKLLGFYQAEDKF